MSNGQMQTRGLSAADWTRLKRLRGARSDGYSNASTDGKLTDSSPIFNKDINPPGVPQIPYGRPIQVYRSVGTSKIRRPASDWIAYRASQTADYPTPSGQVVPGFESGTAQVMTKLCNCNNSLLETKVAGCIKCRHDPIENYTKEEGPATRPVGNGLTYSAFVFDNNTASDKPSLSDNPSTWGTQDNSRLSLTGYAPLLTGDFIPYFYNGTPGAMDLYDYTAIYMFGFFRAPVSGNYVFTTESDDGLQIRVDNQYILNLPGRSTSGSGVSSFVTLTAGQYYPFDALWSNGSGAVKLIFTSVTVDGQNLETQLGIPLKECFFTSP